MLSCVSGCHEYRRVWKAAVWKNFALKRKRDKIQGIPDGITVGHLPHKISRGFVIISNMKWKFSCI